jgi:hypothetical protein
MGEMMEGREGARKEMDLRTMGEKGRPERAKAKYWGKAQDEVLTPRLFREKCWCRSGRDNIQTTTQHVSLSYLLE